MHNRAGRRAGGQLSPPRRHGRTQSESRQHHLDCQRPAAGGEETAANQSLLAKQGVGVSVAKLPRRKCANKECRQWFHPIRDGQIVCCYECASAVGKEQTRKDREAAQRKERARQRVAEKKERAAWRQCKAAVKSLKHWIDLTQRAVNDICRETELAEGLGCISCGTKTAFAWHAGHYRTTAAAGHLRFNRINIHLQCDVCNVYKSGNIEVYRAALVERYGEEVVLALENNNTPHRWTVEELKEIRLTALADLRALKKQEAA